MYLHRVGTKNMEVYNMYNLIKTRIISLLLACITVLTLIPVVPVCAAENRDVATTDTVSRSGNILYGGLGRIGSSTNVYSNTGLTSSIGSLSVGEGVTVIWYDDTVAYINYSSSSTSSGKFGYISRSKLRGSVSDSSTDVGIVRTSSTTYYDTNGIHKAGTFSSGEYVALLSRADGWDYIEYNISGGKRKRAFVPSSCIEHQYGTASPLHYFSTGAIAGNVDGYTVVYSGPDSQYYAECGSVSPSDTDIITYRGEYDRNGNCMTFISYSTASGRKYGWILYNYYWFE